MDLLVILVIVLVVVIMLRGPKTMPKLAEALGRTVREARSQATGPKDETGNGPGNGTPPTDRPS